MPQPWCKYIPCNHKFQLGMSHWVSKVSAMLQVDFFRGHTHVTNVTHILSIMKGSWKSCDCRRNRRIGSKSMVERTWSRTRVCIKIIIIIIIALWPYVFALYGLTRARQKPGVGKTPLLFSIYPKGSFSCQDHRQLHTPLGLYYFSSSSANWNPQPSDHEPGALPCCQRRGIDYISKLSIKVWPSSQSSTVGTPINEQDQIIKL